MRCELSKFHRFSPHLTTPQVLVKQGFERESEFRRLSLTELRCTTCCFETVFLTLFHTWITCQESCFLKHRSIIRICLEKRSCNTVTDRSCLSCVSASLYIHDDVELSVCFCCNQRLTYNNLQRLKSKIFVNISKTLDRKSVV